MKLYYSTEIYIINNNIYINNNKFFKITINPNLIDSVTLRNGSMVKLNSPKKSSQYFYRKYQPGANTYYGQQNYMSQPYVFRGGKNKANQAETNQIEVVPGGVKTEALLSDVLTGGIYNPEGDQMGSQDQGQGYYDDRQQYNPIPGQNPSNDGYAQPNSYYPNEPNTATNLNDAISYPSNNPQGQPQEVREEYEEPSLPNEGYPQDYPPQSDEQIPVASPYIPVQQVPEQAQYPEEPSGQQYQPYPYQQPTQEQYEPNPYQQLPMQQQPQYQPYPNQQPMQPIVPPKVIPASNAAKNNAPIQQPKTTTQTKNKTTGPKSFKELFKEVKKEARDKINQLKNNNVFRARRRDNDEEFCPYCNTSNPEYFGDDTEE